MDNEPIRRMLETYDAQVYKSALRSEAGELIIDESFILFRLYPITNAGRDEIVKAPKIYFHDTGIRNAIIGDFSDITLRPDRGSLFENFIISECMKANAYLQAGFSFHYWRTKQKAEADLVLAKGKELAAVEIKYGKAGFSGVFSHRYPEAARRAVTAENFYR